MKRLVVDQRGIPTGEEQPFNGFDAQLGDTGFDDSFALTSEQTALCVSAGGRQITVEFLAGYSYAQVFAPKESNYIALEPMTAPTSALTSGRGLRVVDADGQFRAMFRIRIEAV
jgi:galactose mutarotase-like enzyme